MPHEDVVDASAELNRRAAIRDLVIGAALLGLGLVTGGSTLDGRADGIDYVFDGLALGWIAWGLVRLVRGPRRAPS